MRAHTNRAAFRTAVWASVALHAVAAVALVAFVSRDSPQVARAHIDTRAEPQVQMSLPDVEAEVTPAVPHAPPSPIVEPPAKEAKVADPPPAVAEGPQTPQPPSPPEPARPQVALRRPQTLPPEIIAKIRLPGPNPSPIIDTGVHNASANTIAPAVPAIHGPLAASQTVVYALDCSGSMGAGGKFDAARAALVATLKAQPRGVRFQVVVYTGSASPLLPGNGAALPATDANVRAAADALAKLEPRGTSNHLAAVRAAAAFRPDVILLLTDAADLSAPALKAAAKPVALCVGRVTADGVQSPHELK